MKTLSFLLTLALVGVCHGDKQEHRQTSQSKSIGTKDKDKLGRQAAGKTLGNIDPEAKAAIQPSPNCSRTRMGIFAGPPLGPWETSAPRRRGPSLRYTKLIKDKDSEIRYAAAEALGKIGPKGKV